MVSFGLIRIFGGSIDLSDVCFVNEHYVKFLQNVTHHISFWQAGPHSQAEDLKFSGGGRPLFSDQAVEGASLIRRKVFEHDGFLPSDGRVVLSLTVKDHIRYASDG